MPTFATKLIVDELNYNKDELEKTHTDMLLMNKDVCMTRSWSLLVLTTVDSFSYMVTVVLEKPLCGKHCRLLLDRKGYLY
jgi:hypothetical protein